MVSCFVSWVGSDGTLAGPGVGMGVDSETDGGAVYSTASGTVGSGCSRGAAAWMNPSHLRTPPDRARSPRCCRLRLLLYVRRYTASLEGC
jgi:hypothetical protein